MNWLKQPKDKLLAVLAAVIFLGVALMTAEERRQGSGIWPGQEAAPTSATAAAESAKTGRGSELAAQERLLSERVASAVSKIEGVGATEVVVSLAQGTQSEYATNSNANNKKIEEKDKSGGTRVTSDNTDSRTVVVVKESTAAKEQPVVVRELRYQVAGVLVVAEGARDANVRQNISRAVCTLLDIPAHKVSVFPREEKR
ncbi:stage iii sporulation protein ag, putative [Heliomicrobium modesticaldum Ice1]|uniref:Stage iii sporulation protein ag, putative n=1 Tax=Heliobacterium modesticaldum (strain ATCC 51547 / Ice1) TaxID=498761 RepID=B0TEI0_HELMI|nr:stage III sporulation protein AG [Heliomicrobium modesticaldum]ABZ82899.1 stage iii sporulation protein ag, putative [Heliomicrobium modesticaldum Ice1]